MLRTLFLPLILASCVQAKSDPFEACQKANPSWFECAVDADCTVISNPCGHPMAAAHSKHAASAEACNIREGTALSCPSWKDMGAGKTRASCREKKCIAEKTAGEARESK